MLRTVMDEELGLNLKNCHLFALVPNYYWHIDPVTNKRVRVNRKTSFLTAATTMLADELLHLYDTGTPVTDHSMPEDSPMRVFNCKAVLLYWYRVYFFANK